MELNQDEMLTQLENRLAELERIVKTQEHPRRTASSKVEPVQSDLLLAASKFSSDLKKIETDNSTIAKFLKTWVEVEPIIRGLESGESLLQTPAKLAILLACEDQLTTISNHLSSIQELEKFINSSTLQETAPLIAKSKPIEAVHQEQKEIVSQVCDSVHQSLSSYHSVMNIVSQKFVYWDHTLSTTSDVQK
eukprot:TRINITY_DN3939_c0_g1_i1.p1 TRINITY_DN3939_c0_g1~~TRINITY_DN3939_c0_g1_i1.p1  ORF type:complete len:192 (+),score=34.09 TRINITY_DN3939_c0_g1_i1:88-663(+)